MRDVSKAWRDDVGIAGHVLVARVCSRLEGGQRGTFYRCRGVTSRHMAENPVVDPFD